MRRVLFAGACVTMLIVLFYAEEDWRGWHAWNQFKHQWEAKGERFSLASVVPPPVPDEQNFAMTAIAFTSYGQVLTRTGKLIPPEERDEHFAVRMRMLITVEYPGPTECIGDRVEGRLTPLGCWQKHYRELATWTNAFPVPAQPQAPAADVLLALSKYDGVVESMRGELAGMAEGMAFLRRHPERVSELQALINFAGNRCKVKSLPPGWIVRFIPAGWFYQNQYQCARMLEEYCMPMADPNQGSFDPSVVRRGETALAAERASPSNLYARLIVPILGDAAMRFAYGQASVNLARTALALERWRLEREELPESLAVLAPRFIAKLPPDVIDGQPLKYHKGGDGVFVLYSVGWNQRNDGGMAGLDNEGALDMQSGDWVWRY